MSLTITLRCDFCDAEEVTHVRSDEERHNLEDFSEAPGWMFLEVKLAERVRAVKADGMATFLDRAAHVSGTNVEAIMESMGQIQPYRTPLAIGPACRHRLGDLDDIVRARFDAHVAGPDGAGPPRPPTLRAVHPLPRPEPPADPVEPPLSTDEELALGPPPWRLEVDGERWCGDVFAIGGVVAWVARVCQARVYQWSGVGPPGVSWVATYSDWRDAVEVARRVLMDARAGLDLPPCHTSPAGLPAAEGEPKTSGPTRPPA